MRDKIFLDTNIIIYSFDYAAPKKQEKAELLIKEALLNKDVFISFQVIQEFLNVALSKFKRPLGYGQVKSYVSNVLRPLCMIHSSENLYIKAVKIFKRYGFSFYDSLIIMAALEGGAQELWSEDLSSGQTIEGMKVVNPFAKKIY